ncbi:MAG: hypothetical protein WD076_01785 [Parvularculaceae bacterium]
MPVRSFIAAIVALVILLTGSVLIMAQEDATYAEVLALLQLRQPEASLLCVLAGWGAVAAAALALITAFAAFIAEDDDGERRRGFPKGIPIIFLLIALALLWGAIRCVRQAAPETVRVVVAPQPAPSSPADIEPEPLSPPEATPPSTPAAPTRPAVAAFATNMTWRFKYPLILNGNYVQAPENAQALARLFPADDPYSEVRGMLCGKAWVAFTGSASEEGPFERNERRARVRAELVAAQAKAWLSARGPDCPRPAILAIDLGQHAPTGAAALDGADTSYQRQVLVASRASASADEALGAEAAAAELRQFLADPGGEGALLAGRRFQRPPRVFIP